MSLTHLETPTLILAIVTDSEKKGMALRTIIPVNFPFGEINVVTTVNNSKGDSWEAMILENEKQVSEVVNTAFTGNPLFAEVKSRSLPPLFQQVGLIMTKSVVQFPSDDLTDFYGKLLSWYNDLVHKSYVNNTVQLEMGTAETSRALQPIMWSAYL